MPPWLPMSMCFFVPMDLRTDLRYRDGVIGKGEIVVGGLVDGEELAIDIPFDRGDTLLVVADQGADGVVAVVARSAEVTGDRALVFEVVVGMGPHGSSNPPHPQ